MWPQIQEEYTSGTSQVVKEISHDQQMLTLAVSMGKYQS